MYGKKKIVLEKKLAIDIETTGLSFHDDKILSVSLYDSVADKNIFFRNPDRDKSLPKAVREELINTIVKYEKAGYKLVFQNGAFDLKFLWKELGKFLISRETKESVELRNHRDTLVGAGLLKNRPVTLKLDSLASYYLGIPSWKEDIKDVWADPELMENYNNLDSKYTCKIMDEIELRLKESGRWEFFLKAMEASNHLTDSSFYGFTVDKPYALSLLEELRVELSAALEDLNSELGVGVKINWNSPKQVLKLFKQLGLNVIHPLKGKEAADADVIDQNKHLHPIPLKLHKYKKLAKKINSIESYITEHYSKLGTINCDFNMSNTKTGRLSSSNPNLQQVDKDKKVRTMFTASYGHELVIGDMAQIEVRMAAHYSKDKVMTEMFNQDIDFYGTIAHNVLRKKDIQPNEFKEKDTQSRDVAKVIGLSILYGTGAKRLRNTILSKAGVEYTLGEANLIKDEYFNTFRALKDLRMGVDKVLSQKGFIVNLMGREVDIAASKIYMTGVNALLQSSASDLLLFRQLEIHQRAPWAQLLNIVHDEVIYEVPKGRGEEFKKILKEVMENRQINETTYFRVPLKMDCAIGNNWSVKS